MRPRMHFCLAPQPSKRSRSKSLQVQKRSGEKFSLRAFFAFQTSRFSKHPNFQMDIAATSPLSNPSKAGLRRLPAAHHFRVVISLFLRGTILLSSPVFSSIDTVCGMILFRHEYRSSSNLDHGFRIRVLNNSTQTQRGNNP